MPLPWIYKGACFFQLGMQKGVPLSWIYKEARFFQLGVLPFSWIYKGASFLQLVVLIRPCSHTRPHAFFSPRETYTFGSCDGVGPCPGLPRVVYRAFTGSPFSVEPRALRVARPKTVSWKHSIYYFLQTLFCYQCVELQNCYSAQACVI